jgi:hypothetical protein
MSAMLTYTYTVKGSVQVISTRVRNSVDLGSNVFPLKDLNGDDIKIPSKSGIIASIKVEQGDYKLYNFKQVDFKYREDNSDATCLLMKGDYVLLGYHSLYFEFTTAGGICHRFVLRWDQKKSRVDSDSVAVKQEGASAPAADEVSKPADGAAPVDGGSKPADGAAPAEEVLKPAEGGAPTEEVLKPAEGGAPTEEGAGAAAGGGSGSPIDLARSPDSPILSAGSPPSAAQKPAFRGPNPAVVARRRKANEAEAAWQEAAANAHPPHPKSAMKGASSGSRLPADTRVRMMSGSGSNSRMAASSQGDGGAGGTSAETQPMDFQGGETQGMDVDGDNTQAYDLSVEPRYAVLTVVNTPKGTGVRLHDTFVLDDEFSIGRLVECDLALHDPLSTFSRKVAIITDNGDAGVTLKVLNTNGIAVQDADEDWEIIKPAAQGARPVEVNIDFGNVFGILRGGAGNLGPDNFLSFRVTKPN